MKVFLSKTHMKLYSDGQIYFDLYDAVALRTISDTQHNIVDYSKQKHYRQRCSDSDHDFSQMIRHSYEDQACSIISMRFGA